MQTMEEFIKENGLCTVCAGAGDLWNGDPEQDAPVCTHCKGTGKEPPNKSVHLTCATGHVWNDMLNEEGVIIQVCQTCGTRR